VSRKLGKQKQQRLELNWQAFTQQVQTHPLKYVHCATSVTNSALYLE